VRLPRNPLAMAPGYVHPGARARRGLQLHYQGCVTATCRGIPAWTGGTPPRRGHHPPLDAPTDLTCWEQAQLAGVQAAQSSCLRCPTPAFLPPVCGCPPPSSRQRRQHQLQLALSREQHLAWMVVSGCCIPHRPPSCAPVDGLAERGAAAAAQARCDCPWSPLVTRTAVKKPQHAHGCLFRSLVHGFVVVSGSFALLAGLKPGAVPHWAKSSG